GSGSRVVDEPGRTGGAGGAPEPAGRLAADARSGGVAGAGGDGAGRSPESDSSDSSSGERAGAAVPGNASAADGGGGSCMTSGTPVSGTDLMSCQASPRRIPSVPNGCDFRSTGTPDRKSTRLNSSHQI